MKIVIGKAKLQVMEYFEEFLLKKMSYVIKGIFTMLHTLMLRSFSPTFVYFVLIIFFSNHPTTEFLMMNFPFVKYFLSNIMKLDISI